MEVMLVTAGLIMGAALVVFFLREGGIVEHKRDEVDVDGWWGQPIEEREWL